MFNKTKSFIIYSLLFVLILSGCTTQKSDWNSQYGETPAAEPTQMDYGFYYPELGLENPAVAPNAPAETEPTVPVAATNVTDVKKIAVMLPLSGPNSGMGNRLRESIEIAFLQKQPKNILISFVDLSGDTNHKIATIESALEKQPSIVVGPLFSEDAKLIKSMKPNDLPVLTFSSDQSALGGGVLSVALMPNQSTEIITRKIVKDKNSNILILAPNTNAGYLMANSALDAAKIYGHGAECLIYYDEGDQDSIKSAASRASAFSARNGANENAKEILSDILLNEKLSAADKSSLRTQLEKISKTDTLGNIPFDSALMLGNANDSKSLASFLRYFDTTDAKFYGTAMWDSPSLVGDIQMFGSEYASLIDENPDFNKVYMEITGETPSRLYSMGFDATNLVIGALESNQGEIAYLLNSSGYRGIDGLVRLRSSGENERALRVVRFNSDGKKTVIEPADNFIKPVYQTGWVSAEKTPEKSCNFKGVRASDYIKIPVNLRDKYKSKMFGLGATNTQSNAILEPETVLPEDDSETIINPEFQPTNLGTVDKHMIDEVSVAH